MSIKLPPNLPNQAGAIKQQSAYEKTAKEMQDFGSFMADGIQALQKQYYAKKPELKTTLGYTFQGRAYAKRPGSAAVKPAILRNLLYKGGLQKTKTAILEAVRIDLPKQAPHIHDNIWYQPIKGAMWKRLQTVIDGNSRVPISIKGCKTLDDIRDRLIAAAATESADFAAKVSITMDKDTVVIGKQIYKIIAKEAKGKTYSVIRTTKNGKKHELSIPALRAFLS